MEVGSGPKARLSFGGLSPEVRNMIYRLTLVAGEALEIQALHPEQYQRQVRKGLYRSRTAFRVAADRWRGRRLKIAEARFETTYAMTDTDDEHVPNMAMLSLNSQTRQEAASIFYGHYTFSFADMNCLVPFMHDRTAVAVNSIESFKFQFCLVDNNGLLCDIRPVPGCDTWVQAVSGLAKFEDLRLKRLVVHVEGQCNDLRFTDGTINIESPTTRWISALRKSIIDLEMLGISYARSRCTCNEFAETFAYFNTVNHVEKELWNILAPRMLKRIGHDHDGSTLQHRRIHDMSLPERDGFSSEDDYMDSSTSESGSDSD